MNSNIVLKRHISQAALFAACIFVMGLALDFHSSSARAGDYIQQDNKVVDLTLGVNWARCSLGQTWTGSDCAGTVGRYSVEAALEIAEKRNAEDGTDWRLPTRKELEGLVCKKCDRPKIDADAFPGTSAEPYWTSESNNYAPVHSWSVNFFTGHTYGRFYPNQELAVRLVESR